MSQAEHHSDSRCTKRRDTHAFHHHASRRAAQKQRRVPQFSPHQNQASRARNDGLAAWFVGFDPLGDGLVETRRRGRRRAVHLQRRPDFKPNLSPKEVLQAGSFGGGYFRDITSSVTKTTYRHWKELPEDWLGGLDVKTQVASQTYRTSSTLVA